MSLEKLGNANLIKSGIAIFNYLKTETKYARNNVTYFNCVVKSAKLLEKSQTF